MDHGRVLLIDDDGSFVKALRQVFRRPDFTQFQLIHLVPTEFDIVREAAEFVTREFEGSGGDVVAILLDIVFDSHSSAADRTGTAIAAQIRQIGVDIPLIAVTDHSRQDALLVDVSFDVNFDGIVPKDVILDPAFDYGFFQKLLTVGRKKLQDRPIVRTAVPPLPKRAERKQRVLDQADHDFGFANDVATVYQMEEIGGGTLSRMLKEAFGKSIGTVRSFSPGFSGAFLFAMDIIHREEGRSEGTETYWILKISRDAAGLKRELESHRSLRTRGVPKDAYPALLSDGLFEMDGWAGIVMERASQCRTLSEFLLMGARIEAIRSVMGSLAAFLGKLYGGSQRKSAPVWTHFYSLTNRQKAAILRGLDLTEPAIRRYGGHGMDAALADVRLFVQSDGSSCERLRGLTRNVDTRFIHGDLHSKNILVDGKGDVTAIDFAKVDQGHVVKDVAKLEADLLLSILDAGNGKDTSWRSVSRWRRIGTELLSKEQLPATEKSGVMSNQEFAMFGAARDVIFSISEDFQWAEYRMALLYHLLRSIAYPDVPLPKKALAISCSASIIQEDS